MGGSYYNEIDPYAAAWLRNLILAGHIASGDVDERSIADVRAADLAGYDQCHFFAGIGGWSLALRLAGWPDDRPVWTGSCPCQPFSVAGKRGGTSDARHLWPDWFRLIAECRPPVVFGEQVASKAGLGWFDAVSADLEGSGYAVGAADLCAAGVGAPHIRQRLYFVADRPVEGRGAQPVGTTGEDRRQAEEPRRLRDAVRMADTSDGDGRARERGAEAGARPDEERRRGHASSGAACVLVHAAVPGREGVPLHGSAGSRDEGTAAQRAGAAGRVGVANADTGGREGERIDATSDEHAPHGDDADGRGEDVPPGVGLADSVRDGRGSRGSGPVGGEASGVQGADGERQRIRVDAGPGGGAVFSVADTECDDGRADEPQRGPQGRVVDGRSCFWDPCDWIPCRDGKARPVEPGTFPLAYGVPGRVGRLRAYGNAIVPEVAAEFVMAAMEVKDHRPSGYGRD